MNLQPFKYHLCACGHGEGILLVDVESETVPQTDARGNWQYYCMEGQHIFSVRSPHSPPSDREARILATLYKAR